MPDAGLLSSRVQRGTFTASSKAARYARGDSYDSSFSDGRYQGDRLINLSAMPLFHARDAPLAT
jgi:hypothetical protein